MRVPVMKGVIERRVLVNFRIDPVVLQQVLPAPLRPKLVGGFGIGGICLIRLRSIRPRLVPAALGISSENAAHRFAIQWGDQREGVFVPRRDTSSRLNALVGGRLFPGVHHLADFEVVETETDYSIRITTRRGEPVLEIRASLADSLPASSVFPALSDASRFFEAGALGFSPSRRTGVLDALELRTRTWHIDPLAVAHVRSSHFEDVSRFPPGSVQFDSAFLMRNIEHEWHTHEPLQCGQPRRIV